MLETKIKELVENVKSKNCTPVYLLIGTVTYLVLCEELQDLLTYTNGSKRPSMYMGMRIVIDPSRKHFLAAVPEASELADNYLRTPELFQA